MSRPCGGCEGKGRHWRWCPEIMGHAAMLRGRWAAATGALADEIGSNEPAFANALYAMSANLEKLAREKADEYATRKVAS